MFLIIGIIVVFGSVIGGYIMHHGNVHVLIQPSELVIIGGAALGALVIMCSPRNLKKILKSIPWVFSGSKMDKKTCLDLLSLLYQIFSKIRKEGTLSIEKDIEEPEKSPLFKKFPSILKNHHHVEFICDNLRVFIVGVNPMELEDMMDLEIETHHEEESVAPTIISKVSDSLPGFGIVAAVLGVVITMGKMTESPEVIGHSVAAALVGTFLGILLCYGLFGPIGSNMEQKVKDEAKFFEAIKVALVGFAKDLPPQIAVEAARRVLISEVKPTFKELETSVRKKAA